MSDIELKFTNTVLSNIDEIKTFTGAYLSSSPLSMDSNDVLLSTTGAIAGDVSNLGVAHAVFSGYISFQELVANTNYKYIYIVSTVNNRPNTVVFYNDEAASIDIVEGSTSVIITVNTSLANTPLTTMEVNIENLTVPGEWAHKIGDATNHPRIGSESQPVYVNDNGEITVCTGELGGKITGIQNSSLYDTSNILITGAYFNDSSDRNNTYARFYFDLFVAWDNEHDFTNKDAIIYLGAKDATDGLEIHCDHGVFTLQKRGVWASIEGITISSSSFKRDIELAIPASVSIIPLLEQLLESCEMTFLGNTYVLYGETGMSEESCFLVFMGDWTTVIKNTISTGSLFRFGVGENRFEITTTPYNTCKVENFGSFIDNPILENEIYIDTNYPAVITINHKLDNLNLDFLANSSLLMKEPIYIENPEMHVNNGTLELVFDLTYKGLDLVSSIHDLPVGTLLNCWGDIGLAGTSTGDKHFSFDGGCAVRVGNNYYSPSAYFSERPDITYGIASDYKVKVSLSNYIGENIPSNVNFSLVLNTVTSKITEIYEATDKDMNLYNPTKNHMLVKPSQIADMINSKALTPTGSENLPVYINDNGQADIVDSVHIESHDGVDIYPARVILEWSDFEEDGEGRLVSKDNFYVAPLSNVHVIIDSSEPSQIGKWYQRDNGVYICELATWGQDTIIWDSSLCKIIVDGDFLYIGNCGSMQISYSAYTKTNIEAPVICLTTGTQEPAAKMILTNNGLGFTTEEEPAGKQNVEIRQKEVVTPVLTAPSKRLTVDSEVIVRHGKYIWYQSFTPTTEDEDTVKFDISPSFDVYPKDEFLFAFHPDDPSIVYMAKNIVITGYNSVTADIYSWDNGSLRDDVGNLTFDGTTITISYPDIYNDIIGVEVGYKTPSRSLLLCGDEENRDDWIGLVRINTGFNNIGKINLNRVSGNTFSGYFNFSRDCFDISYLQHFTMDLTYGSCVAEDCFNYVTRRTEDINVFKEHGIISLPDPSSTGVEYTVEVPLPELFDTCSMKITIREHSYGTVNLVIPNGLIVSNNLDFDVYSLFSSSISIDNETEGSTLYMDEDNLMAGNTYVSSLKVGSSETVKISNSGITVNDVSLTPYTTTNATGAQIYANPDNYLTDSNGTPIILNAKQIKEMIEAQSNLS